MSEQWRARLLLETDLGQAQPAADLDHRLGSQHALRHVGNAAGLDQPGRWRFPVSVAKITIWKVAAVHFTGTKCTLSVERSVELDMKHVECGAGFAGLPHSLLPQWKCDSVTETAPPAAAMTIDLGRKVLRRGATGGHNLDDDDVSPKTRACLSRVSRCCARQNQNARAPGSGDGAGAVGGDAAVGVEHDAGQDERAATGHLHQPRHHRCLSLATQHAITASRHKTATQHRASASRESSAGVLLTVTLLAMASAESVSSAAAATSSPPVPHWRSGALAARP